MSVYLKEDVQTLEDVVVTGYYNQRKQTFTGAANNYGSNELRTVSNHNLLFVISALDPSFKVVENLEAGSDPNAIPDIQIRGMNSLPETSGLSKEHNNRSNMPTFILDGFEVSIEKIYDLDPNRITNISILKDASEIGRAHV